MYSSSLPCPNGKWLYIYKAATQQGGVAVKREKNQEKQQRGVGKATKPCWFAALLSTRGSPHSLSQCLIQTIARKQPEVSAPSPVLFPSKGCSQARQRACTKAPGHWVRKGPTRATARTKNVAFFYFRKTASRDRWVPGIFPPWALPFSFGDDKNGHFLGTPLPLSQYCEFPSGGKFTV